MKKIVAAIPARYASERFPAKLMEKLNNNTLIYTTYKNVKDMDLFDDVIVVTDNQIIFNEIKNKNGKVLMSEKKHECGSDRIAEVAPKIDADIIVNVQGDEPFTKKEILEKLLNSFNENKNIDLASLKRPLNFEEAQNPNNVKVITDINDNAIYFSRSIIPFQRDYNPNFKYFKHIGIYAFKKDALIDFYNYPQSTLEICEKIECLRFLENGKKIKMIEVQEENISIDTSEDLIKAIEYIKKNNT